MPRSSGTTGSGCEPGRSEATRERLLAAALELFSRDGFDTVTTRALAHAAQVNQAAIPYHFDSKEGLYHAVAHRIVDMVWLSMEQLAESVREHHRNGVQDLNLAREDVIDLVLALLRKIVNDASRHNTGYYIMREQMQPSLAMDILYDGMLAPLHELLGLLVAALRDKPADDPDVIVEVQVLWGQAVIFGVHRTTIARRLGQRRLDDADYDHIARVIRDMITRQFPLDNA